MFKRKLILIFVLCGQLLWPLQSYAFIPLVAGLIELGGVALEGVTVGQVITGAAITIGASAAATCSTCTNKGPVPVATNPSAMAQPPNWGRDPASGKPVPPPTVPSPNTSSGQIGRAFEQCKSFLPPGTPNLSYYVTGNVMHCTVNGGTYNEVVINTDPVPDPAGYTCSGDSCNLSNPSVVQKPAGMDCEAYFAGGNFSFDNTNPSCIAGMKSGYVTAGDGTRVSTRGGFMIVQAPSSDDIQAAIQPTATGSRIYTLGNSSQGKIQTVTTDIDYVTGASGAGAMVVKSQTVADGNKLGDLGIPGAGTGTTPGTGTGTQNPPVTCEQVGTCGVAQEATQKGVLDQIKSIFQALSPDATKTIPQVTTNDYAPAVSNMQELLPHPQDYQGPIQKFLAKLGFPQITGGQCSLQRTITLFGQSRTIEFVPRGLCDSYQQVANWFTWGLIVLLGWRQVKSLSGDKSELTEGS